MNDPRDQVTLPNKSHKFHLFCNGWRVGSFLTEELRNAALMARKAAYPSNRYSTSSGG